VTCTTYESPHYAVFCSVPPLPHFGPNILLSALRSVVLCGLNCLILFKHLCQRSVTKRDEVHDEIRKRINSEDACYKSVRKLISSVQMCSEF
jgi:hypothetical protein